MLFVVQKAEFQGAIAIVRDDRSKSVRQWFDAPFMRWEVRDNQITLEGAEAAATIPATVYESGVLFLKITPFRQLLRTIKGEKFLTIQVTGDELLVDRVRLPLEPNDMLLYPDPTQAPPEHPSVLLAPPPPLPPPEPTPPILDIGTPPKLRQLWLWPDERDPSSNRRAANADSGQASQPTRAKRLLTATEIGRYLLRDKTPQERAAILLPLWEKFAKKTGPLSKPPSQSDS